MNYQQTGIYVFTKGSFRMMKKGLAGIMAVLVLLLCLSGAAATEESSESSSDSNTGTNSNSNSKKIQKNQSKIKKTR